MPTLGITGASGFIGGAIGSRAPAEGWEVRGIDDGSGPMASFAPADAVTRVDFASPDGLAALAGCDVVLHLAAVSGVVACARDPAASRAINVAGTARLLEWCREHRVPVAFASSLAVVGSPQAMPITEETPPAPTHEYARQKAEGEALVEAVRSRGGAAIAVRMSNIYGTYEIDGHSASKGNVLTLFAEQARGGVLKVNAPGTQKRDFLHVEDAAAGWLAVAACLSRGELGSIPRCVLASGKSYSIQEVAGMVRSAAAVAFPGRSAPKIEVVPNPRGEIELLSDRFEVDPHRTWDALGIHPRHDLKSDLQRMGLSGGL